MPSPNKKYPTNKKKKPVALTDTLTDRSKLQYIPQLVAWVIIRCCSFSLDMSSSFVNLMKQLAAHMSKYMISETTMPIISRENSNLCVKEHYRYVFK